MVTFILISSQYCLYNHVKLWVLNTHYSCSMCMVHFIGNKWNIYSVCVSWFFIYRWVGKLEMLFLNFSNKIIKSACYRYNMTMSSVNMDNISKYTIVMLKLQIYLELWSSSNISVCIFRIIIIFWNFPIIYISAYLLNWLLNLQIVLRLHHTSGVDTNFSQDICFWNKKSFQVGW